MTSSGADRVREHRLRKRASEFAAHFFGGVNLMSFDEFVRAKKQEFEFEHHCLLDRFDDATMTAFTDHVKQHCANQDEAPGPREPVYLVKDLLESWEYAKLAVQEGAE